MSVCVCPGHSRPVAGLEFSRQTDDGVFLISACHDKTAMLRSGETGDWIGTFEGHKGAVWWAALNPPATRAVTCSADFTAKIWDAITGDELHELKHKHIVRAADWSEDSNHVVTGGKEAKLRLFDMIQPSTEPEMMIGHTGLVKVVKYLRDPNMLLSGGEDKTLRLWDVRTLAEARSLSFEGSVNSVELSQDARTMTIAAGNEVSFWETSSWQCIKRFTLSVIEANGYGVNTATLHPQQRFFVAAGGNFWVYVHDFATGAEVQCNKGHHGPVYGVRFTPDGKAFASGGDDGTIRLWRTDTFEKTDAPMTA
mmetsp:Transcript_18102/g.30231  ORF Transcript_18102/g.30231 Transcript_18102/m.30231 type:complete len:310 (-) Transcript_18102:270-1199(-)